MTVWVPMDVYAKFAALSKMNGLPMSAFLVRMMDHAVAGMSLSEAQQLEIRRRLRDQTVTAADVAAAVAREAAASLADVAGVLLCPTAKNVLFPQVHEAQPIPKLGARKVSRHKRR